MVFILSVTIAIYCLLILLFIFGPGRYKTLNTNIFAPKITFSICIAFRNEAENLEALLRSLQTIDYPEDLFEILLVNDQSTDNSLSIIADFCQKNADFKPKIWILSQKPTSKGGKKAALNLAIQQAQHEFIVTTDADCSVPKKWLAELNSFILDHNKTFIAGPVSLFQNASSFLNTFQNLDFLSLQGATRGSFGLKKPFLCNGANLAFAKAEFFRLNGYQGNTKIASGDDIFLMQKFLNDNPDSLGYLNSKNSIVFTRAQTSWKNLIEQRKRWAAKASQYTNLTAKAVSWVVFLANFACIWAVFYLQKSVFIAILLLLKIAIDYLLIAKTARFFDKKGGFWAYLTSFWLYPFFTFFIAISSQSGSFSWKGRRFKS